MNRTVLITAAALFALMGVAMLGTIEETGFWHGLTVGTISAQTGSLRLATWSGRGLSPRAPSAAIIASIGAVVPAWTSAR